MKNFVKKLSAVITLVAMIASLGVCGYAVDTGAAITINGYEWSDVVNGVATVTVTYAVSNDTVGALGATMLTYAKGGADDDVYADEDGVYDEDDTAYADTMQIVGIDQGAPKTLEGGVLTPAEADGEGNYATGTYVVQFPVAVSNNTTSEDGIQLGSGEGAVILIGGDNVIAPGALLLTAPYVAWDVASLTWTGADTIALGTVTVYTEEETDWLEAVAEAAVDKLTAVDAGYTVTANKGDGTTDTITLEGLDLTAVAVAGEGNYAVTVTVPANTATDADQGGIVPAGGKTFVVTVTATKFVDIPKWEVKGDAVLEGGTAIAVELSEEDFAAADAAKVEAVLDEELAGKKVTLNVEKQGEEDSTVVIDVTAEMIVVTNVATDGDAKSYTGTVTVPAGTYAVEGDEDTLTIEYAIVIDISGEVTEEDDVVYGEVDGNPGVTLFDALALMEKVNAGTTSSVDSRAADVDGVAGITLFDALAIMVQVNAGATDQLPPWGVQ